LAVQTRLSNQVGTVGLAVGLTMMIISRKHRTLGIVKLENLDYRRQELQGHENHPPPARRIF
jgi:hypothetical protein